MFTGIIEEVGKIKAIKKNPLSAVFIISAQKVLEQTKTGDSIAVNGVCLTVTDLKTDSFMADVMPETLKRSSFCNLSAGSSVNLERAMQLGGRFGGHIVSGHIDGTGKIVQIRKDDNAVWFRILADYKLLKYIVEKGSVALDGISLTVAQVFNDSFCVSVIPHTRDTTTLSKKRLGDIINIETDCIGKYVEKLVGQKDTGLSRGMLLKNGFINC